MRPLRAHSKPPGEMAAALCGSVIILWMTVPIFAALALLTFLQG